MTRDLLRVSWDVRSDRVDDRSEGGGKQWVVELCWVRVIGSREDHATGTGRRAGVGRPRGRGRLILRVSEGLERVMLKQRAIDRQ